MSLNKATELSGQKVLQPTDALGIRLEIMAPDGMKHNLWLPKSSEDCRIYLDKERIHDEFCFFECRESVWSIVCCNGSYIIDPTIKQCTKRVLANEQLTYLQYENKRYVLYTEVSDREASLYYNYRWNDYRDVLIGRNTKCDICYNHKFVGREHAMLRWHNNRWYVIDLDSVNGTYLNRRRIQSYPLSVGDVITIIGLRIILGFGYIAINNKSGVEINKSRFTLIQRNEKFGHSSETDRIEESKFFNRLPRKRLPMDTDEIEIDAPPMSLSGDHMPLVLRMGSSMVMGTTSLLAGNMTMMLSSVLFPVLTQKYTEKEKAAYERLRREKYNQYLVDKRQEISRKCSDEERTLNINYPPLNTILRYANGRTQLWERRNIDDDFLRIRVGHGTHHMLSKINYPKRRFNLNSDPLEEEMYQLAEREYNLQNVPIMLSLISNYVLGVVGPSEAKLSVIKQLIARITLLYSADEVKTIFLLDNDSRESIDFINYLPHVWNDKRTIRFIATNDEEVSHISNYFQREFEEEDSLTDENLKEILKKRPYYLIFALDRKLFDSMEPLKQVLKKDESIGATIITTFDELPKECTALITCANEGAYSIQYLHNPEKKETLFTPDMFDDSLALRSMKTIANLNIRQQSEQFSLPKTLTFLEMFRVGRVEHLNVLRRWEENNPTKSLKAQIGVATDGSEFTLDLHEKYQGPHGLVAGMTGSGKSEFIITYILSMAVNYHPDEVAFILIDYKGGGLTGAFENEEQGIHLPHLVGTITNLDGSSIRRSLTSIQSELKRRQELFKDTKKALNESTMDIYDYQKLYRNKKVSEPLPHLFIISDEFAELKSQEPEFMEQLISAARIGRSLGVHLILATQKPSGVVNDQIWSNTKFRVCLKVQDRSDSLEMLKRPEAAELTDTGRFYLQVGYNEYFALGQSAWCGAEYDPQDQLVKKREDSIQFIDAAGQVIQEVKPKDNKKSDSKRQIYSVVKYLSKIAKQANINVKPMWLEPLSKEISLQKLQQDNPFEERQGVQAVIGMVDDPEKQSQYVLSADFNNALNLMVIGKAKSGKTTLIESILYSFSTQYSPDEVNYYILDYSGKALSVFGDMLHCGGVWGEGDEKDIETFFGMLNDIIAERKKLFIDENVNSYEAYCLKKKLPLIFVVIDNISGLSTWKNGENIYYTLNSMIRNANAVGIKFIISAADADDVLYRIKNEFDFRLALKSKNRYEYSDIVGEECYVEPIANPGRGVCRIGKRALEMQIARFKGEGNEAERISELKEALNEANAQFEGSQAAQKIKKLRENETYEDFCSSFKAERIPLGYHLSDLNRISIPLKQLFCLSLYFGNQDAELPVMQNYLYAALNEYMHFIVVKRTQGSLFESEEIQKLIDTATVTYYESSVEDSEKLCDKLRAEIDYRKKYRNQYCDEHNIPYRSADTMKKCCNYIRKHTYPLMIIIENMADFVENLSEHCEDALTQIMNIGGGFNYYFLSCYEPNDTDRISYKDVQKAYNPDNFVMLYGGLFKEQTLASVPMEYRRDDKPLKNFNSCLMQYHGTLYPLFMPCGDLKKPVEDEDDLDIIS